MKTLILLLFVFVSCSNNANERTKSQYWLDSTYMDTVIRGKTVYILNDSDVQIMPYVGETDTIILPVDTPMILKGRGNKPTTGIGNPILFEAVTDVMPFPLTKAADIDYFFQHGDTTLAETFHPIGIKDFPDTVKVIMLVLDTSNGYFGFVDRLDIRTFRYPICVYGYEVREWHGVTCSYQQNPYFIEYLDENKKPFPKSIIIWMSKEIKQ